VVPPQLHQPRLAQFPERDLAGGRRVGGCTRSM
jgi:hypothetical protein